MPKLIENVRESLLIEARKEIRELGYSKMTIRSVSGASGIATGTFYNYFKSKEELVASFMFEDWNKAICNIKESLLNTKDPIEAVNVLYLGVSEFIKAHEDLFKDSEADKSYQSAFPMRHKMLRGQLVDILDPFVKEYAKQYTILLTEFIVESMLSWMTEGKDQAEFNKIVQQFF